MIKRTHISLSLCIMAALLLGSAHWFHRAQKKVFDRLFSEKSALEREYVRLNALYLFLKTHPQDIKGLREKKWPFSCNRLKAAKFLDSFLPLFHEMHYQIDPQIEKNRDAYVLKVRPIIIETLSFSDREIYLFLSKLLKGFPGILLPRTLILEMSPLNNTLIGGKFLFEWVYLEENNHEP